MYVVSNNCYELLDGILERPQLCTARNVAPTELVSLPSWTPMVSLSNGLSSDGLFVRF